MHNFFLLMEVHLTLGCTIHIFILCYFLIFIFHGLEPITYHKIPISKLN
jgi:hypothetical protein